MKQFYPSVTFTKNLFLTAGLLLAFYCSSAQVYYATLSGSAEFPSNSSPGTGKAIVTIDGNSMRVQVTFSGLVTQTTAGLPSATTASHIHAPTAIPLSLTSTAGVATTTPTFTGFPLGVREGSYDHTFDMTLASSYNAAFINANGGTPTSAFTILKAAISAGKSYLNIHSNAFPAGEIRGFLVACPTITVSIADAFALPKGVLPNTVYPAYAPASTLTLQASVSGGTGPYSYSWSNGSTTASAVVSPTWTTTYSLTVKDQNGCAGTASKTINVVDISDGKKGDKIIICHNKQSITVATAAVAAHLQHGDMLGNCESTDRAGTARTTHLQTEADLSVKVMANPSPNRFDIQIRSVSDHEMKLTVYDNLGRVIEVRPSLRGNQVIHLGSSYKQGTYLVVIVQGTQKQVLRLVKTN